MRFELESMELDGFRDIGSGQKVLFPKNTVNAILGKNEDESGSNGSGKTSLVMSIPVNIYGPKAIGIATADLKNWHLKQPVRLVGSYRIDDEPLIIDRTLGGKLAFKYGVNDWVTGGVEDVQEKINKIIKLTVDQFLILSHKAQEGDIPFLLKSDSDKKDFLSSFFEVKAYDDAKIKNDAESAPKIKELAKLEGKRQVFDVQLKECEQNVKDATATLEMLNTFGQIVKHEDNLAKLQKIDTEIGQFENILANKDLYLSLHQEYLATKNEHEQLVQKNNDLIKVSEKEQSAIQIKCDEIKKQIVQPIVVPDELARSLSDLSFAIKEVEVDIVASNRLDMQILNLKTQIVSTLKGMKDLNDSKHTDCTHCGQKLPSLEKIQEHIKQHNDSLISKAQDFELQMNNLITEKAAIKYTEADRVALLAIKDQKNAEIATYKAQHSPDGLKREYDVAMVELHQRKKDCASLMTDVLNSEKNLKNLINQIFQDLHSKVQTLKFERMAVSSEIRNHENSLKVAQELLDKATYRLNELKKEILQMANSRMELEIDLKVIEQLSRILSSNGFFGYIFDGILEDLNREINRNIKIIPNVRQYSLQFTPDKIIKTTGNTTKSIVFEIKAGKKDIPFKTLSGGEKLGLIIAVDEALDTVLSKRLGVHIGWKILDEQMTWIDNNSKEAILEFYRSKSHNKAYFLVDHASEFNAAVDSRILVRKKNGIAQVEQ